MVGHGESSAGSHLADPTSPIPSHCAVIILFKSVPVHQLSWLALQELKTAAWYQPRQIDQKYDLIISEIMLINLQVDSER